MEWTDLEAQNENIVLLSPFWTDFSSSVGDQDAVIKVIQYSEVILFYKMLISERFKNLLFGEFLYDDMCNNSSYIKLMM